MNNIGARVTTYASEELCRAPFFFLLVSLNGRAKRHRLPQAILAPHANNELVRPGRRCRNPRPRTLSVAATGPHSLCWLMATVQLSVSVESGRTETFANGYCRPRLCRNSRKRWTEIFLPTEAPGFPRCSFTCTLRSARSTRFFPPSKSVLVFLHRCAGRPARSKGCESPAMKE